ncbi:apoptosis-inducing factor 3-like isoform X2 [Artemia franciscana]|uniref:apoptosis-inducing factor 3-like isoform X2 n=1 Tax=Artemia franciscana TaxID=6661 RepID=UPI0032DB4A02
MGGGCSKSSKDDVGSTATSSHPESAKKRDKVNEAMKEETSSKAVNATPEEASLQTFKIKKVDLNENEMKTLKLDDETEIVVVRTSGKLHAIGSKCPHYGGPLGKGSICDGKVRCPWHGASFSLETGDVEDYPSIDGIAKFPIEETSDHFIIKGNLKDLRTTGVVKPLSKEDKSSNLKVIIVGGGAAGFACADTLRKEGFKGKVTLITRECHLPYDRPKLSKAMSVSPSNIILKPEEYYKNADIEVMKLVDVTGVNIKKMTIQLSNGDDLEYTHLVLATGASPRRITFPGSNLQNVFYLRCPEDANTIASASKGKNVIIAGASFIGMESAAFLIKDAASVTVVERDGAPYRRILGDKVGMRVKELHEENGVKFKLETTIMECKGNGGLLEEVVLSDGSCLKADVLLLGLGVVPATAFLKDSGLELDPVGYVNVDEHLQTSEPSIYAAGDIANFPLTLHSESSPQRTSIGHWSLAMAHGRTAAFNIMGKNRPMKTVPFFWTQIFGKSIRYAAQEAFTVQLLTDLKTEPQRSKKFQSVKKSFPGFDMRSSIF